MTPSMPTSHCWASCSSWPRNSPGSATCSPVIAQFLTTAAAQVSPYFTCTCICWVDGISAGLPASRRLQGSPFAALFFEPCASNTTMQQPKIVDPKGAFMSLPPAPRRRLPVVFLVFAAFCVAPSSSAQQANAAAHPGELTVERIFHAPSLGGHLHAGLAWAPDGKRLSYVETTGS